MARSQEAMDGVEVPENNVQPVARLFARRTGAFDVRSAGNGQHKLYYSLDDDFQIATWEARDALELHSVRGSEDYDPDEADVVATVFTETTEMESFEATFGKKKGVRKWNIRPA